MTDYVMSTPYDRMGQESLPKIGIVGRGFVGSAVENYFRTVDVGFRVFAHDKAQLDSAPLSAVVEEADIIFVAVPTPSTPSGMCHTGIVEDVLIEISRHATRARRQDKFVTVIKSTVYPGFTDAMRSLHPGLRVIFSPEFLTEKNAIRDFKECKRIIGGGPKDDADVLFRAHYLGRRYNGPPGIKYICVPPAVAEMAKLMNNAMLFTKILLANEVHQICRAENIDYDQVQKIVGLDPRVGESHMQVPGHDGQFGAGGHCFPKDMMSLRNIARTAGTNEKLFTAVLERNEELRDKHDWKDMKGRAVL